MLLNGRAPLYLSDYCVPAAGADTRRQLRSSNRHLLAVPRYRLNTYGCRGFLVAGPTVWNFLPYFIRDPTISADCFSRLLKTYLLARYYCTQRVRGSLTITALYKSTYLLTYLLCHLACRSQDSTRLSWLTFDLYLIYRSYRKLSRKQWPNS